MMNPNELLLHYDSGQCWPNSLDLNSQYPASKAYQDALAVRALRVARGENPVGYKIGFTNRKIWDIYNVYAPIWGTVWDSTTSYGVRSEASISLFRICQPRIEPEVIFGFNTAPKPNASLEDLYQSLDWLAPGFEIVQSHKENWIFNAAEAVADSALHSRLVIGEKIKISTVSNNVQELMDQLAASKAQLFKGDELVDTGLGANVLDSPLEALYYFLNELRSCPGSTDIKPGDFVTTGTWTNAWPLVPGESWRVQFGFQNMHLKLDTLN